HDGGVPDAQFAADGQRIVTSGRDRTVRVWDLDGNQLERLDGECLRAYVAPDGRRLLTTAGDEKVARLWDLEGQLLGVLEGHTGDVWVAQFAPDGERVAAGGA
ncbi:MAG: hypothetical protein P1V36_17465, partial [Planctomycetota bacterium]|nr:hypothetical protein [Planctomycetota bacterium]